MRATTWAMPNPSRATRAAMMLELSPLETAAKASARSIPATSRTSRSNPTPVTLIPLNDAPRRRNASGLVSMIATEWSRSSRLRASVLPTLPHPMITTCTRGTVHAPHPAQMLLTAARTGRPAGSLADRGSRRHLQADPGRAQAALEPARRDAAPQAHRAAGVRQRRLVLGGLRPRRGVHHAVGGRLLGVPVVLADRRRGRPGDADRRRVVPPER